MWRKFNTAEGKSQKSIKHKVLYDTESVFKIENFHMKNGTFDTFETWKG